MENHTQSKGQGQAIAIIGAGAAGLTAADTLKDKGYSNVTLFEKNSYAGGKCRSVEIEGYMHELGAGIIAHNNKTVIDIAHKYNVALDPVIFGSSMFVNGETGQQLPELTTSQKRRRSAELVKYGSLLLRYRSSIAAGHTHTHKDLMVPFTEFAAKHDLQFLKDDMEAFFTGYGYGYFENVPAVYVLKYYNLATIKSFLSKKIYTLPGGIQHLWTTVAKHHNIRFNSQITKIERGETIHIHTKNNVEQFDTLVFASPLDEAMQYTNGSEEEQELFSKIQYIDYRTIACSVEGLPHSDGYIPDNYSPSRAGHPVFWHHRHENTNTFTFYAMPKAKTKDEEVVKHAESLISSMGGTLIKVHGVTRWKYFPHVHQKEMEQGYFKKLERLQGQNHTYYVGELLNFSTVGLTSEYAQKLIKSIF